MFEAYITNAALYPEAGVEVGTTLKFPAESPAAATCYCSQVPANSNIRGLI